VLVSKDGRVLVTDFGLARADENMPARPATEPGVAQEPTTPVTPLAVPLTHAGTVMGTPGYVAPEHLFGAPSDARSDQFSFAVSLYAGLYGQRPYPAATFYEYRQLLKSGVPEPSATPVPPWLRQLVLRGLARDPAARFPAMDAFVEALARGVDRRRLRGVAIAGGAGLVAAAAITTFAIASRGRAVGAECKGAERELAHVWNGERRDKLHAVFAATEKPFAEAAFVGAAASLDERARAWTAMYVETCEATRVHHEQPEPVMIARMACLDRRRRELGQLVDVLAMGDAATVERAVQATASMTPLDECADVTGLLAPISLPVDPTVRARGEALRAELGHAKALYDAGKYKAAADEAARIANDARVLGAGAALAEAMLQLGMSRTYLGDPKGAVAAFRDATRVADKVRHDKVRAQALAWLVGQVGFELHDLETATALAQDARAVLARLGGDLHVEGQLETSLARMYGGAARYDEMLAHHQAALKLRLAEVGENSPLAANAYNNLGTALHSLGRITEALAAHQRALEMREKTLGHDHPNTALSLNNVGNQYYALGELTEALRYIDDGLAVARTSMPPRSVFMVSALLNRGSILAELGRFDEAQASFDELFTRLVPDLAKDRWMIHAKAQSAALYLAMAGKGKEALARADEALALANELAKVPDDRTALAHFARARALEALGDPAGAQLAYATALAIDEKVIGSDVPELVDFLDGLSRIALAQHHTADAIALAERALGICTRRGLVGKWLARTQFLLARAVATDGHRDRALELARAARPWYAASPLTADLAAIDAFLGDGVNSVNRNGPR
jgi:tetratricopeptide (TPR) repeat protein